MTTIAAIAQDGAAFMAADTATNVYDRPVYTARKIRRVPLGDGEALIAVAGDAGLLGMAERADLPKGPVEDIEALAQQVALQLTDLAAEHHLMNSEGRMDGSFLLGYAGRLWTLTHAQAVAHEDPGIAALGSGEGPAMGAMHALLPTGRGASETVLVAVQIAIELDRYSGGKIRGEFLPASL